MAKRGYLLSCLVKTARQLSTAARIVQTPPLDSLSFTLGKGGLKLYLLSLQREIYQIK